MLHSDLKMSDAFDTYAFHKNIVSGIEDLKNMEETGLKEWLNRKDEFGRHILTQIIIKHIENSNFKCTNYECIETLLKYKDKFDIDAQDKLGNTALYYALSDVYKDNWTLETVAKTLIKNGACMKVKNKEGICVIDIIPANVIEDILNTCITEYNGSNNEIIDRSYENYRLAMNFSIFSHKESQKSRNELEFIRALNDSESHHHLLYHPVITTFLHIKWQKIRYFSYLKLLVNALFYCLIFYYMHGSSKDFQYFGLVTMQLLITVIGSILMIGEIIQMTILKWKYLQSFENYLDIAILVMTWVMIYMESWATEKSIAALLVVFMTFMLLLLFEKLHLLELSLYISMFRKITFNFLKLAFLLLWMVLAFAVSFYLIINIDDKKQPNTNVTQIENLTIKQLINITTDQGAHIKCENLTIKELINIPSIKERINIIADNGIKVNGNNEIRDNLWDAFLKTMIMSTGEFDYSGLNFGNAQGSKILFAVFVFSIFFVSMNLMNGIAISDIQILRADARKYKVREQVECIICFEHFKHLAKWSLIFAKGFPQKECSFFPNRNKTTVWMKSNDKVYNCFNVYTRNMHEDLDNAYTWHIPEEIVNNAKQIKEDLENKEQKIERQTILIKIAKYLEDKRL